MQKNVDYIIVGLGLAGACLAMQLLRRKKRIVVFDLPGQNRASSIAAGLYNPITGIRVVKTWKADALFPYLREFYSQAEAELGVRFHHPSQLYIPFRSFEEQNDWVAKSNDAAFAEILSEVAVKSIFPEEVNDPLGGILLNQCGHIDTNIFLEAVRGRLIATESYRDQMVGDGSLNTNDEVVLYDDIVAEKIVFCTGIHAKTSSLFSWLPLVPLKGEVIDVEMSRSLNRIYNRGAYIVATGGTRYRVGATYQLRNIATGITNAGRTELELKLSELIKGSFKTCHQDWGIRPATVDRRPLIGSHPNNKNILIFNGLGTKGVSLAPYFSAMLADHLVKGAILEKEANITRVKSLYSGSR